ncbi:MAG: NfeD family protein [Deltaproteobacteria bacterium]|jgi:membrane protein implicated in regulation of membrane protease activity
MDLNLKKIQKPIYLRYTLLNIPGLVAVILILIIIQHWVVLPVWLFWGIIGFWILKDVLLFPFVWRAYDGERPGISRPMIGERGIVKEQLAPKGYVQIQGELWRAVKIDNGPPIGTGQTVKIVKMDGLTLFVEPVNPDI